MTRIAYETETCSRCLGSGQYSYCERYGTRCFKCGGSGKQLTKAATKAREAINEFKTRYNRPARDLEPGQIVRISHKWQEVVSVGFDGGARWLDKETGEWRDYLNVRTKGTGLNTFPDSELEVRYTPKQFHNELVPFAEKLAGVQIA